MRSAQFRFSGREARAEGIAVETIVVADDVALRDTVEPERRRGIAGTVLVHKIAGAAAVAGLPLPEMAREGRDAVVRANRPRLDDRERDELCRPSAIDVTWLPRGVRGGCWGERPMNDYLFREEPEPVSPIRCNAMCQAIADGPTTWTR